MAKNSFVAEATFKQRFKSGWKSEHFITLNDKLEWP